MSMMARALSVSTSGYYAWRNREPPEQELEDGKHLELIVEYHDRSDAPRSDRTSLSRHLDLTAPRSHGTSI